MRVLLAGICLTVAVVAVGPSRFNRKIDEHGLEKEWKAADLDSDEWHEDTFEWKRKEAQKHTKPIDWDALTTGGKLPGNIRDTVLQSEASSGNMQMAFATLKKGVASNEREVNELARRWQGMLATNAVKLSFHPIGGDELLVTEDAGRVMEARDFLLSQPEIAKFRWKDTDFTPTPTPTPTQPLLPKKGKGKKKGAEAEVKSEL